MPCNWKMMETVIILWWILHFFHQVLLLSRLSLILFYSADTNHCYFLLQILFHLYDKDLIQEDAILKWDDEKKNADEADKVFVKQSEKFIQVRIITHKFSLLKNKRKNFFFSMTCSCSVANIFILDCFTFKE